MHNENTTRSWLRPGPGSQRRRALATSLLLGVVAIASAWLFAPSAQAYVGQAAQLIQLTGPSGTVPCSKVVTVKATVTDAQTNQRVNGQSVHWFFKSSPSSGDAVNPALTATDGAGRTSIQVSFGQVSGARKVEAYSADKKFPETITLTCQADIVTPPPIVTPRPTAHAKPTKTSSTGPASTDPASTGLASTDPNATPSSEPGLSPGTSAEPGQSAQPIQTQPSDPLATPSPSSVGVVGSSPAPPTTTAIGNAGTTPQPGVTTQPTSAPSGGDDGLPSILILIGGLGILGAAALFLWTIARRRSNHGQPPA